MPREAQSVELFKSSPAATLYLLANGLVTSPDREMRLVLDISDTGVGRQSGDAGSAR
jgi:hypothetical protein